ncbi:unnamed protein product, partial [Tetraodon nigroviridis]
MAEIKTGIFAKNVQKRLNRAQEKVLQKLGKADETKDEQFEQVVINFRRQESEGSRLQREMKAYMAAIKGMQQASINLSQSLHEVYEPDWHGKDDVLSIGKDCDALWEDFHNKLVDSTLLNLDAYLLHFPDLKGRVAKRSRKLIDYDSARHHLETLQMSGMKNDRKMMKVSRRAASSLPRRAQTRAAALTCVCLQAEDELKKAQQVFDELNGSLQNELATLWDSRVNFYISTFKSVSRLEARFHREISVAALRGDDQTGRTAFRQSVHHPGSPEVSGCFQTGSRQVQAGSRLVSDWFQTGFRLVPGWFQAGFRLVPGRFRLVADWFQAGSGWLQTGSRLVADWFQTGSRQVQAGCRLTCDRLDLSPVIQDPCAWPRLRPHQKTRVHLTVPTQASITVSAPSHPGPRGPSRPPSSKRGRPCLRCQRSRPPRRSPRSRSSTSSEENFCRHLHHCRLGYHVVLHSLTSVRDNLCWIWTWMLSNQMKACHQSHRQTLRQLDPLQMPALLLTGLLTLERLFQALVPLLQGWRGTRMGLRVGSTWRLAQLRHRRVGQHHRPKERLAAGTLQHTKPHLLERRRSWEVQVEIRQTVKSAGNPPQDSWAATEDREGGWFRSSDGSGSEYETAEEGADGGQGGGWASAEDELSSQNPVPGAVNGFSQVPAEAPPSEEAELAEVPVRTGSAASSGHQWSDLFDLLQVPADPCAEAAPQENMSIPSVIIEPASSNEGDDDRDGDIISPTAAGDNHVTTAGQPMKHMGASGGGAQLPEDFLFKVETMHDFEAANSDELELKRGDVVLVVPTESLEDQDAGWLTGIRESDWLARGASAQKGLFPENFTQRLE